MSKWEKSGSSQYYRVILEQSVNRTYLSEEQMFKIAAEVEREIQDTEKVKQSHEKYKNLLSLIIETK